MRVLHMFTNPHLTNGATMFEYRASQYLKEDDIYFDYLVTEKAYNEEIERYKKTDSVLYNLPIDNSHGLIIRELKINKQYYKFFKTHNYDIVYADTENALRSIHLLMARLAGVKVRVVHSHNTGLQTESKSSKYISRLLRNFFILSATDYFACSDLAAEWLFPKSVYEAKNYRLLTNGVDLNQFRFDEKVRQQIRKQYGVPEDSLVIGNVGRFMPQKNHDFMLEIFNEVLKINKKAKLMLIGDGPLKDSIHKKAESLNLCNSVIFVGTTSEIVDYYQAMDIFLMPSLFEGLPITGIEAQANGLPCLFSDSITKELKISELAEYASLKNDSAKKWAQYVITLASKGRKNVESQVIANGYSINSTISFLRDFYERCKGNNR